MKFSGNNKFIDGINFLIGDRDVHKTLGLLNKLKLKKERLKMWFT